MRSALPTSARGRAAAGVYVVAVTVLAAIGVAQPNAADGRWAFWLAAAIATLPALLPLIPLVYVGGALLWNVSGADHGGPEWVVTAGYTLMLAVAAVVNVCLLHLLFARLRTRAVRTG